MSDARHVLGVVLLRGTRPNHAEYEAVLARSTGLEYALPGGPLLPGEYPARGIQRHLRHAQPGNPFCVGQIAWTEFRRLAVKDDGDIGLGFALLARVQTVSLESGEGLPGGLTWLPFSHAGAWLRRMSDRTAELTIAALMPPSRYVQPLIVERSTLWPAADYPAPQEQELADG